jgi:glycosyltransferase involved in cell wall biosynthesis
MGPALGTILRGLKHPRRVGTTRVICIADNVIPHEHRPGDKSFTRYFLKACDGFVTMSEKVKRDLELFNNRQPARVVHHPLYDNFGAIIDKKTARRHLTLDPEKRVILFFGFIRKYKGLDLLLEAYALLHEQLKDNPGELPTLLIAGEFYEDRKPYDELIGKLKIEKNISLHTTFVPDSEVKYFLCAADVVIQPYRNATQSGVTPLAYYFEKPMIVTNVGGLPALVPHDKVGLVAEPDAKSIADAVRRFYQLGENYFLPHLREEKKQYSWENLVNAIRELAAFR